MGFETLVARERDSVIHSLARGRSVVDTHPRAPANEIEDREPTGRAGRTACGQHVIRTDAVIAEHLGGAGADE